MTTALQRQMMSERIRADRQLLEGCRRQDRDSFRRLFELYKDRVHSIAFYFFQGDEDAAREVTQQVFLKLMERLDQFRGESEFDTWLYRIVINTCADERRRRRRIVALEAAPEAAPSSRLEPGESRQLQRELSRSVRSAIESLKPGLRMVVLLKYFEDLSYEDIAQALDCASGTVASRLHRAHQILARRLAGWRDIR